jgi:hypothetical protein
MIIKESALRKYIRHLLQEDQDDVRAVASEFISGLDAAAGAEGGLAATQHVRASGRVLKRAWQEEADVASFKRRVTFIHWGPFNDIRRAVESPRGKDEISTIPYLNPPFTPFDLRGNTPYVLGLIVEGHPTLVANADLNSLSFRKYAGPDAGVDTVHRLKSSGWNRYPGDRSFGSELPGEDKKASWHEALVFKPNDIAPHEKIVFDAPDIYSAKSTGKIGWPEALVDNWKAVGVVVPNEMLDKVKENSVSFEDLHLFSVDGSVIVLDDV